MTKNKKETIKTVSPSAKFIFLVLLITFFLLIFLNSPNFLSYLEITPFMKWLSVNPSFSSFFGALFGASIAGLVAVFIFLKDIEHRREYEKKEWEEKELKNSKFIALIQRDLFYRFTALFLVKNSAKKFLKNKCDSEAVSKEIEKLSSPIIIPDSSKLLYSENFVLPPELVTNLVGFYELAEGWHELLGLLNKKLKGKEKDKNRKKQENGVKEILEVAEVYLERCLASQKKLDPTITKAKMISMAKYIEINLK